MVEDAVKDELAEPDEGTESTAGNGDQSYDPTTGGSSGPPQSKEESFDSNGQ